MKSDYTNAILESFSKFFTSANLRYSIDNDVLYIQVPTTDMHITIAIDATFSTDSFQLYAFSSFYAKGDHILETQKALNKINSMLKIGKYCINQDDGMICYKLFQLAPKEKINDALIDYIFGVTYSTTNEYNSDIFSVSGGYLSFDDFNKLILAKRKEKNS